MALHEQSASEPLCTLLHHGKPEVTTVQPLPPYRRVESLSVVADSNLQVGRRVLHDHLKFAWMPMPYGVRKCLLADAKQVVFHVFGRRHRFSNDRDLAFDVVLVGNLPQRDRDRFNQALRIGPVVTQVPNDTARFGAVVVYDLARDFQNIPHPISWLSKPKECGVKLQRDRRESSYQRVVPLAPNAVSFCDHGSIALLDDMHSPAE